MKRFAATILIRAPAERIWSLLVDAQGYPAWNSTVERIDGRIALGETITVHVKPSPGRAFPVRVTAFEPHNRMVWTGAMPLGLFKGERTFTLIPESGGIRVDMQEVFSGFLSPLIERTIPDLQPAFDRFAADLKAIAEKA